MSASEPNVFKDGHKAMPFPAMPGSFKAERALAVFFLPPPIDDAAAEIVQQRAKDFEVSQGRKPEGYVLPNHYDGIMPTSYVIMPYGEVFENDPRNMADYISYRTERANAKDPEEDSLIGPTHNERMWPNHASLNQIGLYGPVGVVSGFVQFDSVKKMETAFEKIKSNQTAEHEDAAAAKKGLAADLATLTKIGGKVLATEVLDGAFDRPLSQDPRSAPEGIATKKAKEEAFEKSPLVITASLDEVKRAMGSGKLGPGDDVAKTLRMTLPAIQQKEWRKKADGKGFEPTGRTFSGAEGLKIVADGFGSQPYRNITLDRQAANAIAKKAPKGMYDAYLTAEAQSEERRAEMKARSQGMAPTSSKTVKVVSLGR